MLKERPVLPSKLLDTLTNLELDEGLRIHDGSGCVTFVTRSATEFCLNICNDSYEKWSYANSPEEAYRTLTKYLKEPFKVWLY
jgi:hypothetical protein